jgi:hypothetical protein
MMPLYDFECPHHHRFERLCSIAARATPVPCEAKVNQLVTDDATLAQAMAAGDVPPEGLKWITEEGVKFLVREVTCVLKATLIIAPHSNPGGMLQHNAAANRDAAREGRYDPLKPNRRFMAKGRGWRA